MFSILKYLGNISKQRSLFKSLNTMYTTDSINFDRSFERIVKRLLIEFKNEDRIFISPSFRFLVQELYFPNHINIEITNNIALIKNLNICVIHTDKINKNGNFEPILEDRLINKVINNIEKQTKIISVMKFSNISNQLNQSFDCKSTFDLLITDKCVFKLNKHEKNLELIEGDLNELEDFFNKWDFKPLISRNILKNLKQECI